MHPPSLRYLLHKLSNLLVDLDPLNQQILQDLTKVQGTYYPQMVRIVTKVISARLRVRSLTR